MNELLQNLKEIKLNKRNKGLLVVCILAVLFLAVTEISSGVSEEKVITDSETISATEYIKSTEKQLKAILEKIDGAGEVRVMITLESSYENVYAKAYENENHKTDKTTDDNFKEEYVVVKNGSSNEECLLLKVYEPEIKGVAVVCRGGDRNSVKKAITETICALFNISTAKVSVTKMID